MTNIIKPNEPEPQLLTVKMHPDMARLLASILGEYSARIPAPPSEILDPKTEDEKKQILSYHEERKKFASSVCNSLFTNAHTPNESSRIHES